MDRTKSRVGKPRCMYSASERQRSVVLGQRPQCRDRQEHQGADQQDRPEQHAPEGDRVRPQGARGKRRRLLPGQARGGKRTAEALGIVFFVVVVVAVVLLLVAEGQGGHGGHPPSLGRGGGAGSPVRAAPVASGWRAPAPTGGWRPRAGGFAGGPAPAHVAPRGYGRFPPGGGGRVYGGSDVTFGLGIGVIVPIDGPEATHEGAVADENDMFASDDAYVTMSLVSTYDGRVLWHLRQKADVDVSNPQDVQRFVGQVLDAIPPALGGQ